MTGVFIWLWVSCAAACAADFLRTTKYTSATKYGSAIVIAIIGPPLFPLLIFLHILAKMESAK